MKKILLFFVFTFLFYLSNSQITYDLTNNNNLSEINAISSMGNIDDQISMSSDPILTLDINNNGILDYVVSKHALGEVYIMLDYPNFNNSVVSKRIFDELELDLNDPYIHIVQIIEQDTFIAKKTKTFDVEKKVANKAPVESISVNDLNESNKKIEKNKKKNKKKFTYSIKISNPTLQ